MTDRNTAFIADLAALFDRHRLYIPIDHNCIWPIESPVLIKVRDGHQLFVSDSDVWDFPDAVLAHTVHPREDRK